MSTGTLQLACPRRRWRFQFSVAMLMVLTAVTAAVFAWVGRPLLRARQQRLIANEIVTLGAGVTIESLGPAWLRRLFGEESLGAVVVVGPSAPGGRLVGFGVVTGPSVDDRLLEHCGRLSSLRKLNLSYATVTDAGLVHLQNLSNLETIDLRGTKITDAGLQHLGGLQQLQWLDLGGTAVTDAGLAHLRRLIQLRQLSLDGTQVTDSGVEALAQSLPNCEITIRP
jgi:Leucine Rich Repeat (LRR) protein